MLGINWLQISLDRISEEGFEPSEEWRSWGKQPTKMELDEVMEGM